MLNHATLLEKVRLEGMAYLDCWIEAKLKKEKKKEARELAQAKASGQQLKRVITSTKRSDLFLAQDAEESSKDNVLEFSRGLNLKVPIITGENNDLAMSMRSRLNGPGSATNKLAPRLSIFSQVS